MAGAPDDDWDLDTDEIRSTASDDLRETRPNRWRGPPSTWRHMTQEERLLHQNMEQVRNQDLAIHLFNAAMLRHPPEGSHDTQPVGAGLGDWRPPQAWTAWPLPAEAVPRETLLRETHDSHDAFTLRGKEEWTPGRVLEEEVSASMLRIAKERFSERGIGVGDDAVEIEQDSEEESDGGSEDSKSEDSDTGSRGRGASGADEAESEAESEDSNESQNEDEQSEQDELEKQPPDDDASAPEPAPKKQYIPVVSADDDLSYELLRPSARHILSKLDETLTTLHNARMAGVIARDQNDDSASDKSSVISDADAEAATTSKGTPKSKLAKKRPAPASTSPSSEEDDADDESASEGTPRGRPAPQRRRRASKRAVSASSHDSDSDASRVYRLWRENRLNRWGLRDWRDVLGAAALAGFDADVVARAAQRCADLFGQSMELKTMVEEQEGYVTTTCYPGKPMPGKKESDEEEEEIHLEETRRRLRLEAMQLRRARNRRAERTPAEAETQGSDDENEDAARTRSRNRQTDEDNDSSSAESPAQPKLNIDINTVEASPDGLFYCPVAHCKRHIKGFRAKRGLREHFKLIHDQPTAEKGAFYCPVTTCKYHVRSFKARKNLRVHMRNMHGTDLAGGDESEAVTPKGKGKAKEQGPGTSTPLINMPGSEDEMEGAVHVDGFLKPIKIRQGWLSKGGREKGQRNRGAKDYADG
ncbi:hypothetical protein ACHAQH_002293 [Verticillium albo-atrum]